jgi:hypothetical protein
MSLQGSLSIERMCQMAAVSRRSFYRSLKEEQPAEEEMEVRAAIQQIFLDVGKLRNGPKPDKKILWFDAGNFHTNSHGANSAGRLAVRNEGAHGGRVHQALQVLAKVSPERARSYLGVESQSGRPGLHIRCSNMRSASRARTNIWYEEERRSEFLAIGRQDPSYTRLNRVASDMALTPLCFRLRSNVPQGSLPARFFRLLPGV